MSRKYLVIHTAANGLFDWKKDADAPGQPRLAEVTMLKINDPAAPPELFFSSMIKPDGWVIDEEATKLNGLTQQMLASAGVPIKVALDRYVEALQDGYVVVGHSVDFHIKVMRGELRRAGMIDYYDTTYKACTMNSARSMNGNKWPKLDKLCEILRIPMDDPRTNIGDAHSVTMVAIDLIRRGLLDVRAPKVEAAF